MTTSVTRRAFMGKAAAMGGAAIGASAFLAACGGASSGTDSSGGVGRPRHGGTITVGLTGGSSSDSIDPNVGSDNTSTAAIACVFDALVWQNASATPYLRVAEEMTPNKDATVWTIRLRKGVLFHDGREATADDLIYSIKRILKPTPGQAAPVLAGAQVNQIKKVDRYTVELPFAKPYATFFLELDGLGTIYLLPEDFNPKRPIGTGPFKFESFTPGQQSVFTRWDHYWNQPFPYVDKLVLTDMQDETSQVNALMAGQVDCVSLLSNDVLGTVTAGGKKVIISPGGGYNLFTMRVDQAPFNDVRVRQALALMVDRPKMLDIVFGGHGTIGNDVWGIWDPDYNHALPQRHQDIEKAKSLLKAAGHENLTVQLMTGNISQGSLNMAQVMVQQAAQAGVKVNLNQITPTAYFGPNYLKWTFAQDFWYYAPFLAQVPEGSLAGAPFNESHFSNARFTALYEQARRTLDSAKRREIVHEMQSIMWEQVPRILPFFTPVIDGYAPNVHGGVPSKSGISFNVWDFQSLWLS